MEIKRTIIVITMLLTALSGSYAQEAEPYFCVREGAVLEYERKFTDGVYLPYPKSQKEALLWR
mgnify:CR=1 FL=1